MLVFGQEDARRLGHTEIGSDHLLLGILRLPDDGIMASSPRQSGDRAALTLLSLGVTLEAARRTVVAVRGRTERRSVGKLPFSKEGGDVLVEGLKVADGYASDSIEPAHFLLGMIAARETKSAAASVLDRIGVSCDEIRRALAMQ